MIDKCNWKWIVNLYIVAPVARSGVVSTGALKLSGLN